MPTENEDQGMSAEEVVGERRKPDPRFGEVVRVMDEAIVEVKMLRHEVRVVEQSAKQERRINRFLIVIIALLLPLAALTAFASLATYNVGQVIQDCTSPAGTCNDRLNAASLSSSAAIGYRSERERLITDIQVANALGDTPKAVALQKRLDEVDKLLAQALAARAQARDLNAPEPSLPMTTVPPTTISVP